MAAGVSCPLVAAIGASRSLAVVVAVGLLTVFVLLVVLVWTRFGHARPVSKCVVLSLLAHLLLLVYAYSTKVLYGPPGRWTGQVVTVRLRDAADDEEAAPVKSSSPKPWERPGQSDAPALLDAPPDVKDEEPAEPAEQSQAQPAEPEAIADNTRPQDEATSQPPSEDGENRPTPAAEQPQLIDLLPDASNDGPPPTVDEPAASPPASEAIAPSESLAATDAAVAPMPYEPETFVAATKQGPPRRLGDGQYVPEPLQARVAADRLKAAQPFGATPRTEAAVAAALDWLAAAQSADGRWDADAHGAGRETRVILGHDRRDRSGRITGAQADTGVTGLALVAFLGSGETHLAGKHRMAVQHGLEFLLASQGRDGNLAGNAEQFAAMYCHGMATLAVSEAYALSGDERLLPGLRQALQFTIEAQHVGGGWRYQPHDPGDMSQFGWQLMALKSAELGGIAVPPDTRVRMERFLQSCSIGQNRGLSGYRPGDRGSRTMTAEALVCRYFLEAENTPAALDEGAAFVMDERPNSRTPNYYYWYYGTLAMFQRQGEDWRRWNAALQAELLARQRWDGAAAGSYDPDDLWGGYGGRVYSTALAALSLEVYYRYLPVHGRDIDESRLTDRPGLPAVSR